ncbi:MAG: 2-dehydro-3-deoxyphosphogluconate aldolase [Lawsonibacter sp.]
MEHKFELEHIGIANGSLEEAEKLSLLLSELFHLTPRHGKKSEFAGDYFECMREHGLGTHGHIAMRTSDLTGAVEELKEKGVAFNMDTASYDAEGRLTNIYLDGEFGGFAIHIIQK